MIEQRRLDHLNLDLGVDSLVAIERAELREEAGYGSEEFVDDMRLVRYVADLRSGKTTRAAELAKLLLARVRLNPETRRVWYEEARKKIVTIVSKAIVGDPKALEALAMLVRAGLTKVELGALAASEGVRSEGGFHTAGWGDIFDKAARFRHGPRVTDLVAEYECATQAEIEKIKGLSAELVEERRLRLEAEMKVGNDNAALARLKEEVCALGVELDRKNVRAVAATCTCGRYPAGQCSRCAYDDLYDARRINDEHRTLSDGALLFFEGVGVAACDVEAARISLGVPGDEVKLDPAMIVRARGSLTVALGRLRALEKLLALQKMGGPEKKR